MGEHSHCRFCKREITRFSPRDPWRTEHLPGQALELHERCKASGGGFHEPNDVTFQDDPSPCGGLDTWDF